VHQVRHVEGVGLLVSGTGPKSSGAARLRWSRRPNARSAGSTPRAAIVGGCCGLGPQHVAALAQAVAD